MDLGLAGKGALVMASSGGIGRGVATELAREGARVMLFARSEEKLKLAIDRSIPLETSLPPMTSTG